MQTVIHLGLFNVVFLDLTNFLVLLTFTLRILKLNLRRGVSYILLNTSLQEQD
jgi:hypothetical protein